MRPVLEDTNRDKREQSWRLVAERRMQDSEVIHKLWKSFMDNRKKQAANADCPDYREYRWKQYKRFDYSPDDCKSLHKAIEKEVVPVLKRQFEKRKKQLNLKTLRPWDLDVDALGRPPLKPFSQVSELESKVANMFHKLDPQLSQYFETMRQESLLDLENRKGKAPGGYCTQFSSVKRPFIFMNAVGIHNDINTLVHEGGHSFHVFETAHLPYIQQIDLGAEFAEVASMTMELLVGPYLTEDQGGFYSSKDAARARISHLEKIIYLWAMIASVDAIQHWIYENHDLASDSNRCNEEWTKIRDRFIPGIDWTGLGWRRSIKRPGILFFTYSRYPFTISIMAWRNWGRFKYGKTLFRIRINLYPNTVKLCH